MALEDYLPFVELPEFPRVRTVVAGVLWPLIKKNNPGLLRSCEGESFRHEEYFINLGGRVTATSFVTAYARSHGFAVVGYFRA